MRRMLPVWRLSCYLENESHSRSTSIPIALARTFNMIRKLSAASLVVLILLPFTAPFSTCDLAMVSGTTDTHKTPVVPRRSPASFTRDQSVSIVPSIGRRTVRVKLLGNSRRVAPSAGIDLASSRRRFAAPTRRFDAHIGLTTILRL